MALPYITDITDITNIPDIPEGVLTLNELASTQGAHLFTTAVSSFTAIYCGLNWWHYRSMTASQDNKDNDINGLAKGLLLITLLITLIVVVYNDIGNASSQ